MLRKVFVLNRAYFIQKKKKKRTYGYHRVFIFFPFSLPRLSQSLSFCLRDIVCVIFIRCHSDRRVLNAKKFAKCFITFFRIIRHLCGQHCNHHSSEKLLNSTKPNNWLILFFNFFFIFSCFVSVPVTECVTTDIDEINARILSHDSIDRRLFDSERNKDEVEVVN